MVVKKVATTSEVIALPQLNIQKMIVTLIGDSSLICHKWSEKAIKEILDKQMKKAKPGREEKNPDKDYESTLYRLPDNEGYGFPAIAFKAAAVSACRNIQGIPMTLARGAFHINSQFVDETGMYLVPVYGKPCRRQDMVRVGMGAADIRFRGEFKEWATNFEVAFNAGVISPEQILNLFNTAGFAVGVGEWRPEKNGMSGQFHVAKDGEESIIDKLEQPLKEVA